MSRFIAFFSVCILSSAFAQPSATALNDSLERQYEQLINVYTAGGVCPSRNPEVIQRQRALANALSEATPDTGPRVLLFAVTANSLENARRLNEAGAARIGDNGSLLHTAAALADPPMLAYLTGIGFEIDDLGGAGGPALMVAVTSNRIDNAEWLVDHGANVNATDRAGGPVLRYALVCKNQSVVDFLVEAGAVPDAKTSEVARRLGLRL
jgi:ankyrin repeat protein